MNKIKRPDKAIFFVLSIMMLFCFTIAVYYLCNLDYKKKLVNYQDFSSGWLDQDDKPISISDIHDDNIIHKTLTNIDNSDLLFFTAKNFLVEVTVDNEIIYQTVVPDTFSGKTAGVEVVNVDLLESFNNKELFIKVTNPYKDASGSLNDFKIGSEKDTNFKFLTDRYFSSNMCFVCIFLGLMLLFLYYPLSRKKIVSKRVFYLGIFALNIGIFMYCDSKTLQLIFGNEFVWHTIAQLWMHLLLIPLVLYIDRIFEERNNKISIGICLYSIILFIVCMILNFLGIRDLHETIYLVHIGYILAIFYILYLFIKHRSSFKKYISHVIASVCLGIGCVTDIWVLNTASLTDTSTFTRIGMFAFLVIELINTLWERLNDYQYEVKMEFLSSLAYHDGLTNLLNRTSFIEALDRLMKVKENVVIAMFDVNNLKITNDTYGHTAGDDLLICASDAISSFPGSYGKTYRIGGDEFVVIAEDKKLEDDIKNSIKEMNEYLTRINSKRKVDVSIASGVASYKPRKHKDLNDTFNEADKLMYKNKQEIKNKNNQK